MGDVKYSIVVPAYNASAMLLRLLESFELLEGREAMEVIVMDDCSTDDTEAVARAWVAKGHPFAARYLKLEKNSGPGMARTAGLREAQGAAVAFTDTDCIVTPGWLLALVAKLDPAAKIAGVGGRVLPWSRRSIFSRYETVNGTLEPFHVLPHPLAYLVSCNCCFDRAALLEAGGFPANVRTPGGEDIAASMRLFQQGYRFAYAPDALIYHDYRETMRKFIRTWRNYGYGCAYVTHTLLSREELNPQRPPAGVNDWWVINVYPTATGAITLLKDLKLYCWLGRLRGHSWWAILSTYPLRPFERFAYYIGWLEGLSAAKVTRPELNDWL